MRQTTQAKTSKLPLPPGITKRDTQRPTDFYETERGQYLNNLMYKGETEQVREESRVLYYKERNEFSALPENKGIDQFEIWESERFGWCIPTLLISQPGRRKREAAYRMGITGDLAERTYAISLKGEIVTIGGGPQIKQRFTVYVTEANRPAMEKFLQLKEKGETDAQSIRDRIGSRRAQTQLRRANAGFLPSW